jgi:hypothetical protein
MVSYFITAEHALTCRIACKLHKQIISSYEGYLSITQKPAVHQPVVTCIMCILLYYSTIALATGIQHTIMPIVLGNCHILGHADSSAGSVMGE